MADPELVKILRQGSKAWNSWREQQPDDSQIDMSGADLHNIDLSYANLSDIDLSKADLQNINLMGANLSKTNLYRARLSRAFLSGADLSGANLSEAMLRETTLSATDVGFFLNGANLRGANLREADLSYANLHGVDLSDADISRADLSEAILSDANLTRANLSDAYVFYTTFARVDLREAKGLAEMEHRGPSNIELHKLRLPQDGSALHFLRGAGVPDEWIDDYRARMIHPIQYHSCFVSYAHQDDDLVHRLHADLQDKGVRCWFAPHDMHIGDKIRPSIDEAIHLQDKLLLILSEHSVTSDWVEHEVETALARERRDKRTALFPIRLDDAIFEHEHTGWPALVQNERHTGDFTGWKDHDRYQAAFERLIRDLKKADE